MTSNPANLAVSHMKQKRRKLEGWRGILKMPTMCRGSTVRAEATITNTAIHFSSSTTDA